MLSINWPSVRMPKRRRRRAWRREKLRIPRRISFDENSHCYMGLYKLIMRQPKRHEERPRRMGQIRCPDGITELVNCILVFQKHSLSAVCIGDLWRGQIRCRYQPWNDMVIHRGRFKFSNTSNGSQHHGATPFSESRHTSSTKDINGCVTSDRYPAQHQKQNQQHGGSG